VVNITKANVVYFILEMVGKKGGSFSMNDFHEFFIKAGLKYAIIIFLLVAQ